MNQHSFKHSSMLRRSVMMSRMMTIFLLGAIGLCAIPNHSIASSESGKVNQQTVIKGTVTDENGAPLPGVAVLIKGTSVGVATDYDGRFTITNFPADAETLLVSFVGMLSQEIAINGKTNFNVVLKPDAIGIEEIVSIGYATVKKTNVVGSVASVSGEKLESIPTPDVSNAISGRIPGAVVMQGSGEPGANSAKIMVRGRTTLGDDAKYTNPLVVIDGIPGRSMTEVDPIDIENISVLKDASAAIYGSQAANGVILITTKKGKTGKPRLNYQFYQGFMTPTVLPETCSAGDYATMLSEYQDYEGKTRTFSDEDIALYYSGADPWEHPNSDWTGDLIKDWTTTSKHNLTIDGGNDHMLYYLSLGYQNEEAIYKQESTNYQQYNLRAKMEFNITDWLTTSVDYAGTLAQKLYPTKSASAVYGQSTRLVPTQWSFWPNGKPGPDIEYGDNPVVTSTLETGYDDTNTYDNQLSFKASVTPFEGLNINGFFSYDIRNEYRKFFQKPWILYFPQWDTATRDPQTGYITDMELTPTPRGVSAPQLTEYYDRKIRKQSNISFTYTKTVNDHDFSLFGAYEQREEDWNDFDATRKYYISDLVQTLDAGSDTDKTNSGDMGIYARKSWISRLNYSYQGKYLVELLYRRDGSLKFAPDERWGNFPGILLGWRLSEENFWKENLSAINYFKLRGSYGKIGMDPTDPYQYMNKYTLTSGMTFGTGKEVETAIIQDGVANPLITWEKQTSYNLGFEAQLFENKFHLNADVFYNKRSDILTSKDASVPSYTGLALPDENIAEVDNKGFELDAGYHTKLANGLRLDVGGNVSFARNEVIFMDEPARSVEWQQRTGHPYGADLRYNSLGIFEDQTAVDNYPHWEGAKPGDVIFEDYNNDGQITSDDQILMDNTDSPEIFYGITLDLNYKSWTLSVLAQGQGKYFKMNNQDARRGEAGNYFQWFYDDRWTPTNTNASKARAYNRDDLYWSFDNNNSTYWYDDMSYCRLKNVMVNYKLPSRITESLKVSAASIYVTGNNLLLIYSKQKNFDPEIGAPMTYPALKTIALGAKVSF